MYYLAPKCLYRGEYKHGWMVREYECSTTYVSCLCIRSWASPFIVPRGGLGYMHRRQSRGRSGCGALTYSRPPYRRGLEPSCLGTLMMIMHAPESCSYAPSWTGLSIARLYVVVAATSEWLRCCHSSPDPSLGRKRAYSRVRCHVTPCWPER